VTPSGMEMTTNGEVISGQFQPGETAPDGRPPVLFVSSSGGHLAQLLPIAELWPREDRGWVTFPTRDATSLLKNERSWWAHSPTTRNVPNLFRNLRLAWRLLRSERPGVLVSTGAGVAVPFFLVARVLRIPTLFIEVYDRVDSATLTGRLCRPLSTRFCVQWDEQRRLYPAATVIGPLL
jgi:UDP-N-acetylglucosamine:LPS N-acetylglucosamine transferase